MTASSVNLYIISIMLFDEMSTIKTQYIVVDFVDKHNR